MQIILFSLVLLVSWTGAVHVCLMNGYLSERHAFQYAIKELQDQWQDQGYNITHETFIFNEDVHAIARAQQWWGRQGSCPEDGVCSIVVGAALSSHAIALAAMQELSKVPSVSFAATSPRLVESTSVNTIAEKLSQGRFPYFARVVPDDSSQSRVWVDLLSYFQYTFVNIVFTKEGYGEGLFDSFDASWQSVGGQFVVVSSFGLWEKDIGLQASIRNLKKSTSRVSLVALSGKSLRQEMLQRLEDEEMLVSGWVWVACEAFMELFVDDPKPVWAGIIWSFMQSDSQRLTEDLNKLYPNGFPPLSPEEPNSGMSVEEVTKSMWNGFVVDSTRIAVNAILNTEDPTNGKLVMTELLKTTLPDGLTGHVSFTAGGGREREAFFVFNVLPTGNSKIIFSWTGPRTLTPEPPGQEPVIIWPGNIVGNPPPGRVDVEKACPPYVGFGASMALILILLPYSFQEGWFATRTQELLERIIAYAKTESESWKEAAEAVTFRFLDSGCDATPATKSFLEQQAARPPLLAVIGAVCSEASKPTGRLTGALSIPQVAIDSWSTELADRQLYPHFFRLSPDNCRVSAVYVELCREFKWSIITYVAFDDAYGRDSIDTFSRLSSRYLIRVDNQIMYDAVTLENQTVLHERLGKLHHYSTRIVCLVTLTPNQIKTITEAAQQIGVVGAGWQWLLSTSAHLVSAYSALTGALWIEVKMPEKRLHPVLADFPMSEEIPKAIIVQAGDCMLTVLHALRDQLPSLDPNGRTEPIGEKERQGLSAAIGRVRFQGLSGDIAFDARGELENLFFTCRNFDGNEVKNIADITVVRSTNDMTTCGQIATVKFEWKYPESKYRGVVFGGGATVPPSSEFEHDNSNDSDSGLGIGHILLMAISPLVFLGLLFSFVYVFRHVKRKRSDVIRYWMDRLRDAIKTGDDELKSRAKWKLRKFQQVGVGHVESMCREEEKIESEHAGVSVAYLTSTEFLLLARRMSGHTDPTFRDLADLHRKGAPFFDENDGLGCSTPCPRTGIQGCALVDWLPRQHRGACTHYLSWTWGYKVSMFQSALRLWVGDAGLDPAQAFLYCCFFCNNQYQIFGNQNKKSKKNNNENLEALFTSRLKQIGKLVALMDTWDQPVYLTRIWTIYEQFTALKLKHEGFPVSVCIVLPPEARQSLMEQLEKGKSGIDNVERALLKIDSERAEASVESDRNKVRRMIVEAYPNENGFKVIDQALTTNMSAWVGAQVQEYFSSLVENVKSHADVIDAIQLRSPISKNTGNISVIFEGNAEDAEQPSPVSVIDMSDFALLENLRRVPRSNGDYCSASGSQILRQRTGSTELCDFEK